MGDISTLTVDEYLSRSRWGRLRYRIYRHPLVMFGLGPAYLFVLQHRLPIGLMRAGWQPWLSTMATNLGIFLVAVGMIQTVGLVPFLLVHLPIMLIGPRPIHAIEICRQGHGVTIDGTLVGLTRDTAFGRERPWFECACGRRVRFLYLRDPVGCARCHRLDYSSRHLHRQTPGVHRIRRWRQQIGAEERPFGVIPDRPRHHVRFHRIVSKIHAEEAHLVAHLGGIVYDLDRRLRGRRGPKRHDPTKATPRSDPASS